MAAIAAAGLARQAGFADLSLGTVGEAMTAQPVTLPAGMDAAVAARRLEAAGVSGAPVVAGGRVVGVVTLRDLALATDAVLARAAGRRGPTVRELMTQRPLVAMADWPLVRAVAAMRAAGVNRLPVVDDEDRPAGILTRDDVLDAIALRAAQGGKLAPARPEGRCQPRAGKPGRA